MDNTPGGRHPSSHPLAVAVRRVQAGAAELTLRQFSVLYLLTIPGPKTVSEIAKELRIERAVVSRAANRLEAAGLARRIENPSDKRSSFIHPTAAGHAEVDAWAS